MNTFHRLLAAFWALSVLFACTSVPSLTETARPSETGMIEPTKQVLSEATTLPLPSEIGPGPLGPALQMNTGRAAHSATLLPDGRVLIAGGFQQQGTSEVAIASAEIYDPETDAFTPTGGMIEARSGHTATLLPNGQVLIVGGWSVSSRSATAELYDPQTGEFRYTATLSAPRAGMTATLLKTGQVLIAGGESDRNSPQLIAELYNPATNTFIQSGELNSGRSSHTATLLPDGTVLLAGGSTGPNMVLASAELYDPATGRFTYTDDLAMVRYKHAAVLLQDGNVLVIGGSDQRDWQGKYNSVELYDIRTRTFTQVADLNAERFKLADAVALLDNGNILVGGGNRQVELFDTQTQRFLLEGQLDNDYYYSVLTVLKDDRVLITGGYDTSIQPSDKAWIYRYNP